jgi:hypothetical protein
MSETTHVASSSTDPSGAAAVSSSMPNTGVPVERSSARAIAAKLSHEGRERAAKKTRQELVEDQCCARVKDTPFI